MGLITMYNTFKSLQKWIVWYSRV